MATHSSVLAWRIPGTAEPGRLPSMGSHRVGHNWGDLAAVAARTSRMKFYINSGWTLSVGSLADSSTGCFPSGTWRQACWGEATSFSDPFFYVGSSWGRQCPPNQPRRRGQWAAPRNLPGSFLDLIKWSFCVSTWYWKLRKRVFSIIKICTNNKCSYFLNSSFQII